MRRGAWLLAILLTLVSLGVWWTTRNALRIERFDAQRFARMSEQEQAEWLIKQSLARSRGSGLLSEWWARWLPGKRVVLTPLSGGQVRALAEACLRYDLPHLLNRLPAYGENEKARTIARLYRALWYAKAGNPQHALREADAIQVREFRAYVHARMGAMHLQAGDTELARQRFETAKKLLKQSALTSYPDIYLETLLMLAEHSRLRESPHQIADLVRGLPVSYHGTAARRLGQLYIKHHEGHHLNALADVLPPKAHKALKPYRAAALILQGQVQAGYLLALQSHNDLDPLADATGLRALYNAKQTTWAKQFFMQKMTFYIAKVNTHSHIQAVVQLHFHHWGNTSDIRLVISPYSSLYFIEMIRAGCEVGLLGEAEGLVKRTGLPSLRVLGYLECAAARYRAGDEPGARRLVSLAIAELPHAQPDIHLPHAIRSLREAGAQELANHFLNEAREQAMRVSVPWRRAEYFSSLAPACAANGEYGQAARIALMIPELEKQRDELVRIVSEMQPAR